MKKRVATILALGFTAVVSVIIAGCFIIQTITQPSSVSTLSKLTTVFDVQAEGANDASPHYGIVGIKIPNDWKIDSVWYTGGYTAACAYLPPTEKDKEPGGQVDYWTDSLESRFPSGADMKWVVYQSVIAHPVLTTNQNVKVNIKMTSGSVTGTFKLGYFVSDAALDFTDTAYYSVRLNNPITITGSVPVEMTAFAANQIGNNVELKWQTATETNNNGFDIQRSYDNKQFISVGFVKGNGTTSEKCSYSFTDTKPENSVCYYRLKQKDFNGKFEYSKVIEVRFQNEVSFNLEKNYPNPFNPSTNIRFNIPVDANVRIAVYNSLGQVMGNAANGFYQAGNHIINFNAANLTSGIYYYTITAKGINGAEYVKTEKMMLMK